jgi:hypothetical protein
MTDGTLVIASFAAGVVLAASAEALDVGELQQADGADLGERGQLISAALESVYTNIDVAGGAADPLNPIYGIFAALWAADVQCVVCGAQDGGGGHIFARFDPASEGASVPAAKIDTSFAINLINPHGHIATFATFPYVKAGVQIRPLLMNVSARLPELPGSVSIGCVVLTFAAGVYTWRHIQQYDALGTGLLGEFAGGTKSKFLYFRVIEAYNNHVFGAGFDNSDVNKDGQNRLMFSNLGNPLKWGNDNLLAAGVDRDFSDTDAINIGGAGEIIIALRSSAGRLWIGTNRGLHWLQGYGRDSFITDGTTSIAKSLDVVGPNALQEGPDGILYGCSSRGLWGYDGEVVHLYKKLVDPNGHSIGYWDLIWYDPAQLAGGYPGRTNADFVWLLSVPELKQLWVVIPHCNATTGAGIGTDTVIIKLHTETGGFTRQVFVGKTFTHGIVVKRSAVSPDTILFVNAPVIPENNVIYRYRYRSTPTANPASAAMTLVFGEYAPFGPNGVGVCRVAYPTLSWESDALPIVCQITAFVDGQQVDTFALTVKATAPVAPGDGDLWLDTAGTDTSLGNATAGAVVVASNDYLLKRWSSSWNKWVQVSRAQGMKGSRATIPIAFKPTKGTRVKLTLTVSGTGRSTIESLGLAPVPLRGAA